MKKIKIAGVSFNKVSWKNLLFNKTMFIAYFFLAFGFVGIFEVFNERYFGDFVSAGDAAINPGTREMALALKKAVFSQVSEISRESPWTLYIVNYMYLIYTGSGIIFLIALGEIVGFKMIAQTAAGFMAFGLAMVIGGLFTIAMDLNLLNMHYMILSPQFGAGMWLMLPLYLIYIPFVIFEIYLLTTNKTEMARKIAYIVLFLSVGVDIVEYVIQARLFNMNTARHLWTAYPFLTLYFIISAFVASLGVMGLFSYFVFKPTLRERYHRLIEAIRKTSLVFILLLATYEAIAYLAIDKEWAFLILLGPFKWWFFLGYVTMGLVIPFFLMLRESRDILTVIASVFMIVGTYIGRYLFVYGGNIYPMSDRFGGGFEKYAEYDAVREYIYDAPHMSEALIVLGSFGVILAIYKLSTTLFVSFHSMRELLKK